MSDNIVDRPEFYSKPELTDTTLAALLSATVTEPWREWLRLTRGVLADYLHDTNDPRAPKPGEWRVEMPIHYENGMIGFQDLLDAPEERWPDIDLTKHLRWEIRQLFPDVTITYPCQWCKGRNLLENCQIGIRFDPKGGLILAPRDYCFVCGGGDRLCTSTADKVLDIDSALMKTDIGPGVTWPWTLETCCSQGMLGHDYTAQRIPSGGHPAIWVHNRGTKEVRLLYRAGAICFVRPRGTDPAGRPW